MINTKWIGTVIGLALCTTALCGCNSSAQSANQNPPVSSSSAGTDVAWNSQTERQLRDAIASAPANGLKPELFLKGGETGPALTEAALKYASALANGYADPTKLHEVYTIPHPMVDVRSGLQQAIQKGDVKAWLDCSSPRQTSIARSARPTSTSCSLRLKRNSSPSRMESRSSRAVAILASRRSSRHCKQWDT